jgi:AcrR family transcriptional regulator
MANAAGRATRERLILAAERLFAQHGIEAVPLRDVAVAAGQRNVAATNYYFGDRDSLVRAIFDYRMQDIERQQEERLTEVLITTTSGERGRVRGLVEAYTIPLVEQLDEGYFNGFIARMQLDLGNGDAFVADHWMRALRLISGLLRDEFSNLSQETFTRRMNAVVLLGVHYLATIQHLGTDGSDDDWVDDFIDMLVGILEAPSASATEAIFVGGQEGSPKTWAKHALPGS